VDPQSSELGFVGVSQVIEVQGGSRWIIPANLYTPIRQDSVLLKDGAGNEAARAFVAFLKGPEAAAVIEKLGYGTQ
jgi:molybdate transport system substrate-binding protein